MPKTYEPIATNTLSITTSQIVFSNIPSTYTDLCAVIFGRSDDGSTNWRDVRIQINSDTGTNYSRTSLYVSGTSVLAAKGNNEPSFYVASISAGTAPTNTYGIGICDFLSYSNTNMLKTMAATGIRGVDVWKTVNLWRSTAAISSLTFFPNVGNFVSGTSISIYGIKAA